MPDGDRVAAPRRPLGRVALHASATALAPAPAAARPAAEPVNVRIVFQEGFTVRHMVDRVVAVHRKAREYGSGC